MRFFRLLIDYFFLLICYCVYGYVEEREQLIETFLVCLGFYLTGEASYAEFFFLWAFFGLGLVLERAEE